MTFKPVILLYDLNNTFVDEAAALVGHTGLYTTINTYNETNATEAIQQYNRLFGLVTNKISCVVTGWNPYKKPRDQFLFKLRGEEKRSPFRRPTPVVIITEVRKKQTRPLSSSRYDGEFPNVMSAKPVFYKSKIPNYIFSRAFTIWLSISYAA
jgi:hypothetical protein